MMVLGIGIDIVEIARIERLLGRHGDTFLKRVFLPEEIAYCGSKKFPAQHYAARLAVKEAVFKALGEGWTERLGWKDIKVLRSERGKPSVELLGKGRELQREMGVERIMVSLSHSDAYSIAQAVAAGDTGR